MRYLLVGLVVAGAAFGGLLLLGWTIDETRFARDDPGFDRLAAQVDAVPGVTVEDAERWVEAPLFSRPRSWIALTMEEDALPRVLDLACSSDHNEPVSWSVRIEAAGGTVVSAYNEVPEPPEPQADGGSPCPDFGYDPIGVVEVAGRAVPGLAVQPSVWEDDRFTLVSTEDPVSLESLLPLVDHAEELRDAAGLAADRSVAIEAVTLSVILQPGEREEYLALLTAAVDEHGVTSFSADGGGTPVDGVRRIHVAAPSREHAAIQERIRASDLGIADLPISFIPTDAG